MVPRDARIAVCMMGNRKHCDLPVAFILLERLLALDMIERDNPHWNDLYMALVS